MANAGKNKVSVQDLSDIIAKEADVSKKFSEKFLRELIDVISEYLERDGVVKVKGLGTFKLLWVDGRRSVDVTTGNEIVLPAHYKVSFTPEQAVKNSVNEPYAHLNTVVTDLPEDLHKQSAVPAEEPANSALPEQEPEQKPEPEPEQKQPVSVPEIEPQQTQSEDQTDKNEVSDNENADKPKKKSNAKTGIIAAIVILLVLCGGIWYCFEVVFPLSQQEALLDVPTQEEISNFEIEEADDPVYGMAVADSAFEDSLAQVAQDYLEQNDSIGDSAAYEMEEVVEEEVVPLDPFESYTPQTAMDAPVKGYEVVREGSRLTMVAYRAYGRKEFWVYIYDGNRDILSSPSDIETGMELKIPDLAYELVDPKSQKAINKALELAKEY